jgi:superfamily II DNA or RNA helicase
MHALTESGVLVPMRVMSCTRVDMRGAATAGGEWTDQAAAQRGMEIIGDVVAEWRRYAGNRKTIVFGATIAHCEEMARQFNNDGVMAACFTSDTKEHEREQLLTEYRKPDSALRVLLSVNALAKGFDVPDVECVCDVRPLRKSLSEAIQMWGRGLRSSPKTGKTDCLLLDFSGNIIRMADDYSEIYYNGLDALDNGEKMDKTIRRDDEDEPKGKPCPSCGFQPMGKRCVACGYEAVKASLVEHEHGEMREVRIGRTKYADDKRHLWEQAVSYARGYSAPEKQQGRAANIYRDITGEWPMRGWHVDNTPSVPITRAVLNKIKAGNIAYAKARAVA